MSEVFGSAYAAAYDLLYADKDYGAECDLIEAAFREFGEGGIGRLVDLGCGTGGHAVPLAMRGYEVVGVDRSEAMLARARRKAVTAGVAARTSWIAADLASAAVAPPADGALMMFAVLGYQETPAQAHGALAAACRSVRVGGLLILDAWYGPAVQHLGPGPRWRMVEEGAERVIRLAESDLDTVARTCTVSFRLLRLAGDRLVSETVERHRVRYFFRDELAAMLREAGFELQRLSAFPDVARELDETTWSLLAVARRTSKETTATAAAPPEPS